MNPRTIPTLQSFMFAQTGMRGELSKLTGTGESTSDQRVVAKGATLLFLLFLTVQDSAPRR